jgi:hypothetical protein
MSDQSDQLKYFDYVNPQASLSQKTISAMAQRRELHHKAIAERFAAKQLLKSTDEERALRTRIRSELVAKVDAHSIEKMRQERQLRFNKAQELYHNVKVFQPTVLGLDPTPKDSSGIGTLFWAATSVSVASPTAGALVAFFQDGLLRFGGDIEVQSEDLHYGSMHVFAQFGLGPDRMPEGLNFVSNPFINVFGILDGAVFPGFFDFGDQWSKCWLTMTQTVLAPVTFDGIPAYIILGTNSSTVALIFIESNFSIAMERHTFPGFIPLPPVNVQLNSLPRITGIEIDLAINFDMQLEGDQSSLLFHDSDGGTDSLQTFQWDLQPV